MTTRKLPLNGARAIEIRGGADVRVLGWDEDTVQAATTSFFGLTLERRGDLIRVSLGGSGDVHVPRAVALQVHATRSAEITGMTGDVSAYTGAHLTVQTTGTLQPSGAGGRLSLACARLAPEIQSLGAGRDLRFQVDEPLDLHLQIQDVGGRWAIAFGAGTRALKLESGGDVVIVTDRPYTVASPNGITGLIERPTAAGAAGAA